ncbi:MAG: hypothetical protein R3B13_28570 [Polyangiaceae bacterium]
MKLSIYLGYAVTGICFGVGALGACSSTSGTGSPVGGGNAGGSGGGSASGGNGAVAASAGTGGGIDFDGGGAKDGGATDASACGKLAAQAEIEIKPVDVIFIVDNSCSMNEEAAGVEANISKNFANIISASGVDYRVILLSENGPTTQGSICIGAPLGGTLCPAAVDTPPINNPPLFYHYDHNDIESNDGWCSAWEWYDKADRYNLAPGGWKDWLRPESLKAFVSMTDDRVYCGIKPYYQYGCSGSSVCFNDTSNALGAAQTFDSELLTKDPAMFGTVAERKYVWYSIVGVAPNPASPNGAYQPTEPITSSICSGAVNASPGNQALSQLTGGLRFPVCNGQNFDAVFQAIAQGVIAGAKLACEFDLPTPPEGKEFDLNSVTVDYTKGGTTTPQNFKQVPNAAACTAGSFYIDQNRVYLCPDSCSFVQQDPDAKMDVLVDCVKDIPK